MILWSVILFFCCETRNSISTRYFLSIFKLEKKTLLEFRFIFAGHCAQIAVTNGFLNDMQPILSKVFFLMNSACWSNALALTPLTQKSRNQLIITCLCQSIVAVFSAYLLDTRILNIFMEPVDYKYLFVETYALLRWIERRI